MVAVTNPSRARRAFATAACPFACAVNISFDKMYYEKTKKTKKNEKTKDNAKDNEGRRKKKKEKKNVPEMPCFV